MSAEEEKEEFDPIDYLKSLNLEDFTNCKNTNDILIENHQLEYEYLIKTKVEDLYKNYNTAFRDIKLFGKDWDNEIKPYINPKRIGVFSGPAIGQLDYEGMGGLLQSRKIGKRATSKHLSMSLIGMSADFINAYILGSLGKTGTVAGACATFLYNLDLALKGIKNNELDFTIVGSSEAPINPEITDGFLATTGIADDKKILEMQKRNGDGDNEINYKNMAEPKNPIELTTFLTLITSYPFFMELSVITPPIIREKIATRLGIRMA